MDKINAPEDSKIIVSCNVAVKAIEVKACKIPERDMFIVFLPSGHSIEMYPEFFHRLFQIKPEGL